MTKFGAGPQFSNALYIFQEITEQLNQYSLDYKENFIDDIIPGSGRFFGQHENFMATPFAFIWKFVQPFLETAKINKLKNKAQDLFYSNITEDEFDFSAAETDYFFDSSKNTGLRYPKVPLRIFYLTDSIPVEARGYWTESTTSEIREFFDDLDIIITPVVVGKRIHNVQLVPFYANLSPEGVNGIVYINDWFDLANRPVPGFRADQIVNPEGIANDGLIGRSGVSRSLFNGRAIEKLICNSRRREPRLLGISAIDDKENESPISNIFSLVEP